MNAAASLPLRVSSFLAKYGYDDTTFNRFPLLLSIRTFMLRFYQVTVVCNAGYHLAISKHPFDPTSSKPSQLFLLPSRRRPPPMISGTDSLKPASNQPSPSSGAKPLPGSSSVSEAANYLTPHHRVAPPMYQPPPGNSGNRGPSGSAAGADNGKPPPLNWKEDVEDEGPTSTEEPKQSVPSNATKNKKRGRGSEATRPRSDYVQSEGEGKNVSAAERERADSETHRGRWEGPVTNSTICLEDMQFHPPLICLPDPCAARPPPEHGFVLPPGPVAVGRRVSLGCDPGYVLWGDGHVLEGVGHPDDAEPSGPADGWSRDMWLARPLCLPQRQFTPGAICVPTCGVHGPVEHATVRLFFDFTSQPAYTLNRYKFDYVSKYNRRPITEMLFHDKNNRFLIRCCLIIRSRL